MFEEVISQRLENRAVFGSFKNLSNWIQFASLHVGLQIFTFCLDKTKNTLVDKIVKISLQVKTFW